MKKTMSLLLVFALLATLLSAGMLHPAADEFTVYGDSGKVYFAVPDTWQNFKTIRFYLSGHDSGEDNTHPWGSKRGNMTDEGNGIWSYDLSARGYDTVINNEPCSCIFTADWGAQTCELIIDAGNFGDLAYCTGVYEENPVDSNKKSCAAKWQSGHNGSPLTITFIGNIVGDTYWPDEDAYSIFYRFISTTGYKSIKNAVKYNGKTEQETIDDLAAALGLSLADVRRAVSTARTEGVYLDWRDDRSPLYDGGSVAPTDGEPGQNCDSGSTSGGSSSSTSGSASGSSLSWSSLFSFTMLEDGTLELSSCTGKTTEIPAVYPDDVMYAVNDPYATEGEAVSYKGIPVTRIGDWAFYNNKYIESVSIPDSITSIGKGAFYGCPRLTEMTVPDSVTALGANAFEKCLYLTRVTLGAGITAIEDETFYDCRRLTDVNIPDGVTSFGEEAFYNCRSLQQLALPNGLVTIGSKDSAAGLGVFEECRSLNKLIIPDSVQTIGENAFDSCGKLRVYGSKHSAAEAFAESVGVPFKNVGNITASAKIIGDTDQNNELNINDVSVLQRFISEFTNSDGSALLDVTDPKVLQYADVNGDGVVNVKDATQIQRFLAEFIESFC